MDRIEINVRTGVQKTIQLTPQEEADAIARSAAEPAPETELEAVERKLTADPLERRRIKMEANRRGVSPASIVAAILAEA